MAYTTYVKVDVDKLIELMKKETGGNKQKFSTICGHERGWINHIISKSHMMSQSDILLLKSMYGVDVTLKEEKPKPKEEPTPTADYSDILAALNKLTDEVHKIYEELTR